MEHKKIDREWARWCHKNAGLYMEEIAQAHRMAEIIGLRVKNGKTLSFHVGETSHHFIDKVKYFLPGDFIVENTDEKRGWNNYLVVSIVKK